MLILKILGFLLKAIGIILLAFLVLLVLLLLVVLFVPVRYRASIIREGTDLKVKARISWLGSILHIPITFQDGALDYKAKLLCFTVFPRKIAQTAENADESSDNGADVTAQPEDKALSQTEAGQESLSGADGVLQETKYAEGDTVSSKSGEKDCAGEEAEEVCDTNAESAESEERKLVESEILEAETEETENEGFFERICVKLQQVIGKIKEKYQQLVVKVCGIKDTIKQKISEIKEKIVGLKGRISDVLIFLRAEDTKFALRLAGKSIFQLIKYILPYKIKGEVIFGTGDPYSMGQALSILGIFYGVYARTLQVEADFEATEFRLDVKLELKGRIRMIRLLYIALKLWFKGKLKQVIANAKGLTAG